MARMFKRGIQWGLGWGVFPLLAARLTWVPIAEPDVDGYQIHFGSESRVYEGVIDVGLSTSYDLSALESGRRYYLAVTAYDIWGNQSDFSEEVIYAVEDIRPPELISVEALTTSRIQLVFSEPLDPQSATQVSHYAIFPDIRIWAASLQEDGRTVWLETAFHPVGNYLVTVSSVKDLSQNAIPSYTSKAYRVEISTAVAREGALPEDWGLGPNYPNPFNPHTRIPYRVKQAGRIRITVVDLNGRLVRILVDEEVLAPGEGVVEWDGTDGRGEGVASGVYFCRLEAMGVVRTRRMQLIR